MSIENRTCAYFDLKESQAATAKAKIEREINGRKSAATNQSDQRAREYFVIRSDEKNSYESAKSQPSELVISPPQSGMKQEARRDLQDRQLQEQKMQLDATKKQLDLQRQQQQETQRQLTNLHAQHEREKSEREQMQLRSQIPANQQSYGQIVPIGPQPYIPIQQSQIVQPQVTMSQVNNMQTQIQVDTQRQNAELQQAKARSDEIIRTGGQLKQENRERARQQCLAGLPSPAVANYKIKQAGGSGAGMATLLANQRQQCYAN
ncbi:MAG: hypothetical protein IPO13_00940 [Rhodocyclaceae bacterium]|nr:hypothetical protein [Rhodocyclaceae bacterium]